MFSSALLQRGGFLTMAEWLILRNCVLSEFPILKMIPLTENKQSLLPFDSGSLVLVLRASCCVSNLFCWCGVDQVYVQKEPPGLGCWACGSSNAAIQHSRGGHRPGAVLKKLHVDVVQQTIYSMLFEFGAVLGILGDPKASKAKPPLTRVPE